MYHEAYHQEAQRRQRVIDRKHLALERLKEQYTRQLQELGKNQKTKEKQTGKDERTGTRAGTRSGTRSQTRATTREVHSRDTLWLPDICQTTTGRTYYQLFPPKPKPLHQWRDLKNRIRHDYNLVPLPYKEEDVVKR
ncbi:uncharacterized protein LOC110040415 [Orbicella faveolata]|uniref:uncharacterized protein LOC110040415 n=1 Tax=Orbicella faveolata TaxID=48498 RepID=UPI0009E1BE9D|nr:uncharacterized protein LOC110040415 [Orbicella faveolata]